MPPPGDIRHCMEALANTEPVMEQLLTYRFPAGSGNLTGQSFGNLILAALNGISDSFDQAGAGAGGVQDLCFQEGAGLPDCQCAAFAGAPPGAALGGGGH